MAADSGLALTINQIDSNTPPGSKLFVTVADDGIPVGDLDRSAFAATEDGRPVDISSSQTVVNTSVQLSVALVFDTGGLVTPPDALSQARQAADSFVDGLSNTDSAAVFAFKDDAMKLVQPFTNDKTALHAAIGAVPARARTPLYDPLISALKETATVPPGQKVVIALSDGTDVGSTNTDGDVIAVAARSNIPVHVIGIGPGLTPTFPERLTNATGGTYRAAKSASELNDLYAGLSKTLRAQYVLQVNTTSKDSQTHKLAISVHAHNKDASGEKDFVPIPPPKPATVNLQEGQALDKVVELVPQIDSQPATVQKVEYAIDGSIVSSSTRIPFSYNLDPANLPKGAHTLTIKAYTDVGGTSTRDIRFSVGTGFPLLPLLIGILLFLPLLAVVLVLWRPRRRRLLCLQCGGRLKPEWTVCPACGLSVASRPVAAPASPVRVPEPSLVSTNAPAEVLAAKPAPTVYASPGVTIRDATLTGGASANGARLILQRAEAGPAEFAVSAAAPAIVGRDPASSAVLIDDPGVSRRHAAIERRGADYVVADLGSANGTFLNGRRVLGEERLRDGDEIKVGSSSLIFRT